MWLPGGAALELQAFGAEGQGVNWYTSAGSITPFGRTATLYVPERGGDVTVRAQLQSDANVLATATVHVFGGQLTPSVTTLKPGESTTLSWLNAEQFDITWSATGGTINGAGSTVTYTAPETEGEYHVTAQAVGEPYAASARVFVTSKELATILYYADSFVGTDYLGLAMRPYDVTYAASWPDFDEKLASGEYDLAIALVQAWYDFPDVEIMTEHVNRGGRVIYTDWTADPRFEDLFEFQFTGWFNMSIMELHPPLDEGVPTPTTLLNPGWNYFSMGLEPVAGGESRCTFPQTGDSCLAVGNDGRTIVLGFLADVPMAAGGERLFSNIIEYFNIPFVPADPDTQGFSLQGGGGFTAAPEDRGCLDGGNRTCR